MRHSYLGCPTPNSSTIPVYYLLALLGMLYFECPTSYNWVSYYEYPTRYKCALLRADTVRSLAPYKIPTPVGAGPFGQTFFGMGRITNGFIAFSPMENVIPNLLISS